MVSPIEAPESGKLPDLCLTPYLSINVDSILKCAVETIGSNLLATASALYKRPIACDFKLTTMHTRSACTNGRTVWINKSFLLNFLAISNGILTEEIAALIGHEIGHCIANHTEKMKRDKKTLQEQMAQLGVWSKNYGDHPATTIYMETRALIIQLQETYGSMCESYEREKEADQIGVLLFMTSGYCPENVNVFLEFSKKQIFPIEMPARTLPALDERIKNNQKFRDAVLTLVKVAVIIKLITESSTIERKPIMVD